MVNDSENVTVTIAIDRSHKSGSRYKSQIKKKPRENKSIINKDENEKKKTA